MASEHFDHTSVLRFLELFTDVRETDISARRRATFGDMSSAFHFGQARRTPPVLPSTAGRFSPPSRAPPRCRRRT